MNGAIFSKCGRYRHWLERDVVHDGITVGPTVGFFGVNASTADGTREDQTTRKWNGFCRVNHFGRYLVGNPFDYIATDVRDLATAESPYSPKNQGYLCKILDQAEILIPCWGNRGKLPKHLWLELDSLKEMIFATLKPVLIFGLTASGDPKHPLMLPYSTELVEWKS